MRFLLPLSPRAIWLTLFISSVVIIAVSLILPAVFNLAPCYLCIFQRLLWLLLALLAAVALFIPTGITVIGRTVLLLAGMGMGAAGYQSWLQFQPANTVSCVSGTPNLIEQLIEWLGHYSPTLFLATGFCEDRAFVILNLSLANWSLVAFLLAMLLVLLALRHTDAPKQTDTF